MATETQPSASSSEGRESKPYTVIGHYQDDGLNYVGCFCSNNPEEAARIAVESYEGLLVSGVIEGHHEEVGCFEYLVGAEDFAEE